MLRWDRYGLDERCALAHYIELVFLHLGGSVGHIVLSRESGP
jgi:hypothetical protein